MQPKLWLKTSFKNSFLQLCQQAKRAAFAVQQVMLVWETLGAHATWTVWFNSFLWSQSSVLASYVCLPSNCSPLELQMGSLLPSYSKFLRTFKNRKSNSTNLKDLLMSFSGTVNPWMSDSSKIQTNFSISCAIQLNSAHQKQHLF